MPFRSYSSDEVSFSGVSIYDIYQTHGMRLCIKDMGNGVLRAYSPLILPKQEAERCSQIIGNVPIEALGKPRLVDLAIGTASAVGVADMKHTAGSLTRNFARVIDDSTIEMVGWIDWITPLLMAA